MTRYRVLLGVGVIGLIWGALFSTGGPASDREVGRWMIHIGTACLTAGLAAWAAVPYLTKHS